MGDPSSVIITRVKRLFFDPEFLLFVVYDSMCRTDTSSVLSLGTAVVPVRARDLPRVGAVDWVPSKVTGFRFDSSYSCPTAEKVFRFK